MPFRKIPVKGDYRVQDDYGASDRPFVHISKNYLISLIRFQTIPRDLVYVRLDYLNLRGFTTNDWVINEVECVDHLYSFVTLEAAKEFVKVLQECYT